MRLVGWRHFCPGFSKNEPLRLPIAKCATGSPLTRPLMEASSVNAIPPRQGVANAPKWDGFRCLVFRDGERERRSKLERFAAEFLANPEVSVCHSRRSGACGVQDGSARAKAVQFAASAPIGVILQSPGGSAGAASASAQVRTNRRAFVRASAPPRCRTPAGSRRLSWLPT